MLYDFISPIWWALSLGFMAFIFLMGFESSSRVGVFCFILLPAILLIPLCGHVCSCLQWVHNSQWGLTSSDWDFLPGGGRAMADVAVLLAAQLFLSPAGNSFLLVLICRQRSLTPAPSQPLVHVASLAQPPSRSTVFSAQCPGKGRGVPWLLLPLSSPESVALISGSCWEFLFSFRIPKCLACFWAQPCFFIFI